MANRVRISVVAPPRVTEDKGLGQPAVEAMIRTWRGWLEKVLPDQPHLILVPEACDRYCCHDREQVREYYRARGDQVRDAFAEAARRAGCHVAYAAYRGMRDGTHRNSIQILAPTGDVLGVYDKNHPTTPELEHASLPGTEAPLFDLGFARVGCAICFDLNFEELRRHYAAARPDLILFASMFHGGLLQPWWAYSCRCHLVTAVAGLPSGVVSPVGERIASTTNYRPYVTAEVNLDCLPVHLDFHWEKLAALKARYGRRVSIHDPGLLGSVLVTSEDEDVSAEQMAEEFEMERLDDYFNRCRRWQDEARRSLCGKDG